MNSKDTLLYLVAEKIKNSKIREITLNKLNNDTPAYFWEVPASSTGKHHPEYSLGHGGLVRHTIAAFKLLDHMLKPESVQSRFTPLETDCMLSAIALHDTRKCGTQEEYDSGILIDEKWSKTAKNHELLVVIPIGKGLDPLTLSAVYIINQLMTCHMGQWGACHPRTYAETLVHLADYLASRKNITVNTDYE
jgi:hypothetical protein